MTRNKDVLFAAIIITALMSLMIIIYLIGTPVPALGSGAWKARCDFFPQVQHFTGPGAEAYDITCQSGNIYSVDYGVLPYPEP